MLLLLGDRSGHCSWCEASVEAILESPEFNRLAGGFHALMLDVDDDPHKPGRVMFDTMDAKGLPTFSLMAISQDGHINELVKINGYYPGFEYAAKVAAGPSRAATRSRSDRLEEARRRPVAKA